MRLLRDMLPILRSAQLAFDSQSDEDGDVVSFRFRRPAGLSWKAGQHGVFTLPGVRVRGRSYRVFSIASAPSDEILRIATRIRTPVSDFKRHLLELGAGDRVSMRGPLGPFYIHDPSRPVVFVAAGIGITPFLGMLRDRRARHTVVPESIDLVYGVWKDVYPFRDEVEQACDELPGFTAFPRAEPAEVRSCVREMAELRKNDADYFVSGEFAVVRSLKKTLRRCGIARSRIRSDWFSGYGGASDARRPEEGMER